MEGFQNLLVVMVMVWVTGKIFRALSLPVLFGELIGGIIVGPAVLGLVDPTSETITVLAELGVFFLMLHAGLENDPKTLLKASKKSFLIALSGITLPFLAVFFSARFFGQGVEQSLFIATALSMTAIAITIRLFKDYHLQKTSLANTCISAAIFSDIIGLILFSVVLQVVKAGSMVPLEMLSVIGVTLFKLILFFGFVIIGGMATSKYLAKILCKKGFTFALIAALSLGILAEALGLHMIIGAFLAGLLIREEVVDEKVYNKIEDRMYGLGYGFLGPIFFTTLAFSLKFDALIANIWFILLLFVSSVLFKVIGAGGMALLQKFPLRKSLILGIAMNSRGVIDLVIASVGLEKGVIDADIFSILVFMAIMATLFAIFAVKPLLRDVTKN